MTPALGHLRAVDAGRRRRSAPPRARSSRTRSKTPFVIAAASSIVGAAAAVGILVDARQATRTRRSPRGSETDRQRRAAAWPGERDAPIRAAAARQRGASGSARWLGRRQRARQDGRCGQRGRRHRQRGQRQQRGAAARAAAAWSRPRPRSRSTITTRAAAARRSSSTASTPARRRPRTFELPRAASASRSRSSSSGYEDLVLRRFTADADVTQAARLEGEALERARAWQRHQHDSGTRQQRAVAAARSNDTGLERPD